VLPRADLRSSREWRTVGFISISEQEQGLRLAGGALLSLLSCYTICLIYKLLPNDTVWAEGTDLSLAAGESADVFPTLS
jgi:hypothetical protein